MKLMCLKYVPTVLGKCSAISKTRSTERAIKGKIKKVLLHELVCEVKKDVEIRVIIEKVGTGNLRFKSVMPHNHNSKPKKRPDGRSLAC